MGAADIREIKFVCQRHIGLIALIRPKCILARMCIDRQKIRHSRASELQSMVTGAIDGVIINAILIHRVS